ncbi:MAG: energy-coupling factor ABC transporter permease [Deltaproteobacteria bacterium]|nr:energy-coupling factor ABC transporter permease [Deltaproteobacteria bacterium]
MRKTIFFGFSSLGILVIFFLDEAYGMHISDGILPLEWAFFWYLVLIPFIVYGIKQIRVKTKELLWKPLLGLSAALVFAISCMPLPVPIVGTCSHPCGTSISAIFLGPFVSVVVAFCALLLQALFLAHGGLSTLGANTVSMGVIGSFLAYFTYRIMREIGIRIPIAGFFSGLVADWATYATTSMQIALGIRGENEFFPLFWKVAIAFIPTQLPIGIAEGAMTATVLTLIYQRRPEILLLKNLVHEKGEKP